MCDRREKLRCLAAIFFATQIDKEPNPSSFIHSLVHWFIGSFVRCQFRCFCFFFVCCMTTTHLPDVERLLQNLPPHWRDADHPVTLELVLDGGVFNGSYMIGGLMFLKAMEARGYIRVRRISGSSVGSIVGCLYLLDCLDAFGAWYEDARRHFAEHHNFALLKDMPQFLRKALHPSSSLPRQSADDTQEECDAERASREQEAVRKVNGALVVTYYDGECKVTQSQYASLEELADALIRSAFLPWMIDGRDCYQGRYRDGINPWMVEVDKEDEVSATTTTTTQTTTEGCKVLYMDLHGLDKFMHMWNIKNERTNLHRILSGMLDVHAFFIKETPTSMCSFVSQWGVLERLRWFVKQWIERIAMWLVFAWIRYCHRRGVVNNSSGSAELNTSPFPFLMACAKRAGHAILQQWIETYCL